MIAAVRLPSLVSDGMILQRDMPANLWGWASPSEKVVVTLQNSQYSTTANADGQWSITLPKHKAGGPFTIQINEITVKDVLFGDIYLCSGQSNMELPIKRVIRAFRSELTNASNPNIREFKVPLVYNFQGPQQQCGGQWKSVTPDNILDFSAVGYFFASSLYSHTKVPVGIINSSVGGSPAEAWINEEALKPYAYLLEDLNKCKDQSYIEKCQKNDQQTYMQWQLLTNANDMGLRETPQWSAADVDASNWEVVQLPGRLNKPTEQWVNGSYWLRKSVVIPQELATKTCDIELGCIIDCDSVYINGKFVGTTGYMYPPRIYRVPEGLLHAGENQIAIRLMSYGGRGGFVLDKPYEIRAADGSLRVDLKGDWHIRRGATTFPRASTTFFQYKPTGLYNGMIAPLHNLSLRGVIWYQGESNVGRATEYEGLVKALISTWRQQLNAPALPFILVQLPNFQERKEQPTESAWAELRAAQANVAATPNAAIITTYDIGEWNDIHPLNKKEVGKRLSDVALRTIYGDTKAPLLPPTVNSAKMVDGKVHLTFDNVQRGWGANTSIQGFAIKDTTGKWLWAKASIEGTEVVVWVEGVDHPTEVSYAWSDNPATANLRTKEGILTIPFRVKPGRY